MQCEVRSAGLLTPVKTARVLTYKSLGPRLRGDDVVGAGMTWGRGESVGGRQNRAGFGLTRTPDSVHAIMV